MYILCHLAVAMFQDLKDICNSCKEKMVESRTRSGELFKEAAAAFVFKVGRLLLDYAL